MRNLLSKYILHDINWGVNYINTISIGNFQTSSNAFIKSKIHKSKNFLFIHREGKGQWAIYYASLQSF